MRIVNRLIEYVIITLLITSAYYTVTIPFALFVWELNEVQFHSYIWQGLLIDLFIAYPIGKCILYVHPRMKNVLHI